jgi:hypothetical protein
MLHGPSPLSVMSSGSLGSLSLGASTGLASLLAGRAAAAAGSAASAAPLLAIAPLCVSPGGEQAREASAPAAVTTAAAAPALTMPLGGMLSS